MYIKIKNLLNFYNFNFVLNFNKYYTVSRFTFNNTSDFYVRIDNIFYKFESASALNAMSIIQFMLFLRLNDKIKNANNYFEIPRFCYHHLLSIAANCRICLIEESGALKLVAACATFFKNKANYFTKNALVRNAREHVLEYLLINHPLDCPICDQGGECDLQDITKGYGMDLGRFFNKDKKAVIFRDFNKEFKNYFIKFKMTRCIHCTRCIRYFTEILDISLLGMIQRGFSMKVSIFVESLYDAYALGNVIDICPVGALKKQKNKKTNNMFYFYNFINKIYFSSFIFYQGALTSGSTEDKVRAWELIQKYTIDVFDNLGSDIRVDFSGSKFFRVIPKLNQEVNDSWISDITRFSYYGLKVQRLSVPYLKKENIFLNNFDFISVSWQETINFIWKYIYLNDYILSKKISFSSFCGIFSDAKTLLTFKYFNNFLNTSNFDSRVDSTKYINFDIRNQYLVNLSKINLKNIKYLFLLGVNLRLESPLLFIRVNQQKKNLLIFYFGFSLKVDKFIVHAGTNLFTFFKFLAGKHYLSTLLQTDNFSKSYVVLGNSIINREDSLDIINSLVYFKNNSSFSLSFGCLNQYLGRITAAELGFVPGISYYNKNVSLSIKTSFFSNILNIFFILNNSDDFNFLNNFFSKKENIFTIFLGSHCFDYFTKFCNILLPVTSFSEKLCYFLNVEGSLRSSNIIEFSNNKVKESSFFFSMFYKFYIEYLNTYKSNISIDNLFFFNAFYILEYHWFILLLKKKFNLNFFNTQTNKVNFFFDLNFNVLKNFWYKNINLTLNNINLVNSNSCIYYFIKKLNSNLVFKNYFFSIFKFIFFNKPNADKFNLFSFFFLQLFSFFVKNFSFFRINLISFLPIFVNNYFFNNNFLKLNSNNFFNNNNDIDHFLSKKLIKFSNIFLINNKYYIRNNSTLLSLKYYNTYLFSNLIFNSIVKVSFRNIFLTNVISAHSLEVREIINRVNNFFSNFK